MNDIKNSFNVGVSGSGNSLKIIANVESSFNISKKQEEVIYKYLSKMRDEIWDLMYLESEEFKNFRLQTIKDLKSLFPDNSSFVEIENQYSNDAYYKSRPWLRVATHKGVFEVGWRKRVISISWDNEFIPQSGYDLFPEFNVTRWEKGIHAWSLSDAKQYINRLLK